MKASTVVKRKKKCSTNKQTKLNKGGLRVLMSLVSSEKAKDWWEEGVVGKRKAMRTNKNGLEGWTQNLKIS
jgi:hypothetical protein